MQLVTEPHNVAARASNCAGCMVLGSRYLSSLVGDLLALSIMRLQLSIIAVICFI